MAMKQKIDFTNVRESSGINPKHVEAGDYLAKIVKVEETMKDGTAMWNYHFQLEDMKSAIYPFYCKLQENQLWKLRNLLVAAGKQVPKKAVTVDAESIVGKTVAITLDDDEYEGKMKSVITATFPASELTETAEPADDDLDEEDLPEEEEEEEDELEGLTKAQLVKRAKGLELKVLRRHTEDDLKKMIREAEAEDAEADEDDEELDLDELD